MVGIIGAGMLLLGPLAWGFIRQTRGLPAFDNNAAAWRLPDQDRDDWTNPDPATAPASASARRENGPGGG